jgi:4-amino-4-deoxy-L-arabinose transferase-like glycosyltransferase
MPAPGASRVTALCLTAVLAAYFAVGAQYAALTPPWQVPDEPAHYNYIRHIAETGGLPVLMPGDYDQAHISQLTAEGFPPHLLVDSLRYEGHQPPLYYLLAAPIYLATGGALLPLRLFSLALGAGVVVFTFLIARGLFPAHPPLLALTAAGLVAFIPQHLAMLAGVNNDSLAELTLAATLWVALAGGTRRGQWWIALLGLFVGLAFVTKATAYIAGPVAALAVWFRARREGWPAQRQARAALALLLPALALGALWWARNLAVYGWPDFLGLQRHDEIIIGQPRTADWIAQFGWPAYLARFAVTTFNSFWGQFGWMGVVMDARVYAALLALSLLILAGIALAVRRAGTWPQAQRDGLRVLAFSAALTCLLYLYYNVDLVQHQGRYLFTALIPLAVWAALGLRALADGGWQAAGGRAAVAQWIPLAVPLLLSALDLLALYRFILPALPRY